MRGAVLTGLALLALLGACSRQPEDKSAADDSTEALMAAAFPGWVKGMPASAHLRWSEADENGAQREAEGWVLVEPGLVARLDADHVVLVVTGKPSDESGHDVASHASGGNLGAYWFERHGARWRLSAAQPSFTWTGFFGDPGKLRHVLLGAGHQALALENGSCWQGQCGQWLELYEIGDSRVLPLLAGKDAVALEADSTGASDTCGDLLAHAPGTRRLTPQDEFAFNSNCLAVSGKWSIHAREAGPGDLDIHFTGRHLVAEGEPVADASAPATPAVVSVQEVDSHLIYRFHAGRYAVLSGENPLPGF